MNSLHSRSEGVPFFLEELTRAYREAEALQLIDGTWTLTKLSGPAVPSSIQSLVERRLAQLSEDCRSRLADAGVLGRRFRLADLARVPDPDRGRATIGVRGRRRPAQCGRPWSDRGRATRHRIRLLLLPRPDPGLAPRLTPGSEAGYPPGDAEHLAAEGGEQTCRCSPITPLEAGDRSWRSSGIQRRGPRRDVGARGGDPSIDATLPAASEPEKRIEMLRIKDDALAVLERGVERMANLAEMTRSAGRSGHPPSMPRCGCDGLLRRGPARTTTWPPSWPRRCVSPPRIPVTGAWSCRRASNWDRPSPSPDRRGVHHAVEVDVGAAEDATNVRWGSPVRSGPAPGSRRMRELAMIEAGRVKHRHRSP